LAFPRGKNATAAMVFTPIGIEQGLGSSPVVVMELGWRGGGESMQ
jgi:hypothetical protein